MGSTAIYMDEKPPTLGTGKMRVELDKKALFALASDTRLEILRALQPMRRTVTQLAEAMGIDKAAVYRHLRKLIEGGLVKRHDDHGFVYYGLSWKARDLLNPNDNTKIVILLASSALLVLGGVVALMVGLTSVDSGASSFDPAIPEILSRDAYPEAVSNALWLIPATVLPSGAVLLFLMALRMLRRPKQGSGYRFGGSGS
ncbi:MAG: winged helix-turn-helix domain-containing protein [Thermoplasmata archaeon]